MAKRQEQKKRVYSDDMKPGETPGLESLAEAPTIKREFILTQSADNTLQDAIRLLSRATGTDLSNSHFLRVLLKVVAHAMRELEVEASSLGKLKRPGNARTSQAEREEYERRLAEAVAEAVRNMAPFEAGGGRGKRSA